MLAEPPPALQPPTLTPKFLGQAGTQPKTRRRDVGFGGGKKEKSAPNCLRGAANQGHYYYSQHLRFFEAQVLQVLLVGQAVCSQLWHASVRPHDQATQFY